jgi:beta-lactamase class A
MHQTRGSDVIALALSMTLAAPAQKPPASETSGLQKQLEAMASRHRGDVALYARNLKTGDVVQIDPDHVVQTASVIKLAIFVEAFHQIKDGKKSLADKVTFKPDDRVVGSGVLQYLHAPLELTLEDALVLMMVESDNTATNLVIDQVGLANVNGRIASLGLRNTYLYKKVYKPPEGPMPADQKTYGLGKTTAREMAAIMESIERCELGDQKLCARMIEIMKGQQYRNMIPHYLEVGLDTSETPSAIADKVGMLDAVRNDVGILYSKNGPIVISAFTFNNKDQRWIFENEAELLIAHMARAIVDAWSPKGLVSEKAK